MKVALVDLDDCISDTGWRQHLIRWEEKNPDLKWREFHQNCGLDPLLANNYREILSKVRSENGKIIIASARPEYVRDKTMKWCNLHGVRPFSIMLRPEHNRETSPKVKARMVDYIQSVGGIQIKWAFDDRQDILDMYRERGIQRVYQMTKEN